MRHVGLRACSILILLLNQAAILGSAARTRSPYAFIINNLEKIRYAPTLIRACLIISKLMLTRGFDA